MRSRGSAVGEVQALYYAKMPNVHVKLWKGYSHFRLESRVIYKVLVEAVVFIQGAVD